MIEHGGALKSGSGTEDGSRFESARTGVAYRKPSKVDSVYDEIALGMLSPNEILEGASMSPAEVLALSTRLIIRSPEHRSSRLDNAIDTCKAHLREVPIQAKLDNSPYVHQLADVAGLIDSDLTRIFRGFKGDEGLPALVDQAEREGAPTFPGKLKQLTELLEIGVQRLIAPGHSSKTADALAALPCTGPASFLLVQRSLGAGRDYESLTALLESAISSKPPYAGLLLDTIEDRGFPKSKDTSGYEARSEWRMHKTALFMDIALRQITKGALPSEQGGSKEQQSFSADLKATLLWCMGASKNTDLMSKSLASAVFRGSVDEIEKKLDLAFEILAEGYPYPQQSTYKKYVTALADHLLHELKYDSPERQIEIASVVADTPCPVFWQVLGGKLKEGYDRAYQRQPLVDDEGNCFGTRLTAEAVMVLMAPVESLFSYGAPKEVMGRFLELYNICPPQNARTHAALLEQNPKLVLEKVQADAASQMRESLGKGSPRWVSRGVPLHQVLNAVFDYAENRKDSANLEQARAKSLSALPPLAYFDIVTEPSTPARRLTGGRRGTDVPNYLSAVREEEVGHLILLAIKKNSPALARYILASEEDKARVLGTTAISQSEPFKRVLFPEQR